jgi:hypothetical protein
MRWSPNLLIEIPDGGGTDAETDIEAEIARISKEESSEEE